MAASEMKTYDLGDVENLKSDSRTAGCVNPAKRGNQAAPSKGANCSRSTVARAASPKAKSASSPGAAFGFRNSDFGFQKHTSWLTDHFAVSKRYSRYLI